jgi:hypothetical protein
MDYTTIKAHAENLGMQTTTQLTMAAGHYLDTQANAASIIMALATLQGVMLAIVHETDDPSKDKFAIALEGLQLMGCDDDDLRAELGSFFSDMDEAREKVIERERAKAIDTFGPDYFHPDALMVRCGACLEAAALCYETGRMNAKFTNEFRKGFPAAEYTPADDECSNASEMMAVAQLIGASSFFAYAVAEWLMLQPSNRANAALAKAWPQVDAAFAAITVLKAQQEGN